MASVDFIVRLIDRVTGPAKNIERAMSGIDKATKAVKSMPKLDMRPPNVADFEAPMARWINRLPLSWQTGAAKITSTMDSMLGAAGSAGSKFGGVMAGGAGMALTALSTLLPVMLAVGAAGAGLVAAGANYAAKMAEFKSNALFAFKYITGSQKGAESLFKEADALARSMGAKTTDVVAGLQELMAGGFDESTSKKVVAAIADVHAMNPTADTTAISKQLAQMKGAGKVTMEDLKPILNAGVDDSAVYGALRQMTGAKDQQALMKLISAGKVTSDQGTQAILEAVAAASKKVDPKNGGVLGAIAKDKSLTTVSGAISVLEGNVERLFMAINTGAAGNGLIKMAGKLAGLFDPANASGQRMLAMLDREASMVGQLIDMADGIDIGGGIDSALAALTAVGGFISSTLAPAASAFVGAFGPAFSAAITPIKALLSPIFAMMGGGPGAGTKMLIETFRVLGFVLGICTAVAVSFFAVLGIAAGVAAGAFGMLMTGISMIGQGFAALPGMVMGFFSDAGSWLADVGGNIVSGLWGGLTSAWGAMLSQFDALVALLPASVRSVLGIASPSRVMMQLGAYTGEGFAAGMAGQEGAVDASMTSLVQPRVSPKVRGAIDGARGKDGESTGGTTVNVNIGDIVLSKGTDEELKTLREKLEAMMREVMANISPEVAT